MNVKQIIIGSIGSLLAIIGCLLPLATFQGDEVTYITAGPDGIIVAGLALAGLIGAVIGIPKLLLVCSILGAIVFGYTWSNYLYLSSPESAAVLFGISVEIGIGGFIISGGLLTMFIGGLIPSSKNNKENTAPRDHYDNRRPRYRDDQRPRYRDDQRPQYRGDQRPRYRDDQRPQYRGDQRPRYRDDQRPQYRDDQRPRYREEPRMPMYRDDEHRDRQNQNDRRPANRDDQSQEVRYQDDRHRDDHLDDNQQAA